jgi:hypothetical protein
MVEHSVQASNTNPTHPVVVGRIGLSFLGVTLLYIALVITPFYGNGIHLSSTKPFTSQFYATRYPPFSWVSWGRQLWLWTHFVYLGGLFAGVPLLFSWYVLVRTRFSVRELFQMGMGNMERNHAALWSRHVANMAALGRHSTLDSGLAVPTCNFQAA